MQKRLTKQGIPDMKNKCSEDIQTKLPALLQWLEELRMQPFSAEYQPPVRRVEALRTDILLAPASDRK